MTAAVAHALAIATTTSVVAAAVGLITGVSLPVLHPSLQLMLNLLQLVQALLLLLLQLLQQLWLHSASAAVTQVTAVHRLNRAVNTLWQMVLQLFRSEKTSL